ncbi:hypothetical protein DPMN_060754 [Dreissena polymorpha]|uniref:Uncharacterized protein n=1 Tax=Dreissena polymorpha TaxID=45954 RepID=A0A9D4C5U1_DREPO|nr:hypothetical protein DPMN_060754 [Dreissena polymorpha]
MQRLQERFGAKELPATAQGRFQVAHQELGESLDDWSDRVLRWRRRPLEICLQLMPLSRAWHGFVRD